MVREILIDVEKSGNFDSRQGKVGVISFIFSTTLNCWYVERRREKIDSLLLHRLISTR